MENGKEDVLMRTSPYIDPSLLHAQGYPTKLINILNYLNSAPIDGALEENSGLTT